MSLKAKLMEDLKRAMRERDEVRKSTIRLVRAAIANTEQAKRDAFIRAEVKKGVQARKSEWAKAPDPGPAKEALENRLTTELAERLRDEDFALDDKDVLAVIAKEAKQRRDAMAEYKKAGRQDLAAQEEAELQILTAYLPQQMSPQEIEASAREVIAQVGATGMAQMGQVMRPLMAKLKGRADGRQVNEIVRRLLTEGGR
jgi:uncharacterized protein YqeY